MSGMMRRRTKSSRASGAHFCKRTGPRWPWLGFRMDKSIIGLGRPLSGSAAHRRNAARLYRCAGRPGAGAARPRIVGTSPFLADKTVRMALSSAIDRVQLAAAQSSGLGDRDNAPSRSARSFATANVTRLGKRIDERAPRCRAQRNQSLDAPATARHRCCVSLSRPDPARRCSSTGSPPIMARLAFMSIGSVQTTLRICA